MPTNDCRISPCDVQYAIKVAGSPEPFQFLTDASIEVAEEDTAGSKYLGKCDDASTSCKWTFSPNGATCVGDGALCEADCSKEVTICKYYVADPSVVIFEATGKITSYTVTDTASEDYESFTMSMEGTGWTTNLLLCPPTVPVAV